MVDQNPEEIKEEDKYMIMAEFLEGTPQLTSVALNWRVASGSSWANFLKDYPSIER